jgi:immune inhibitor A
LKIKRLAAASAVLALSLSAVGTATATEPRSGSFDTAPRSDKLPNPLADRQAADRARAQQKVIMGSATPQGSNHVVKLAKNRYVELAREGEDSILTVLGQFGTAHATDHPASHGDHGGTPGPLHNEIPKPDRKIDNATIWHPDFSEAYYAKLLFSDKKGAVSMRNYYIEQSSGRYAVNGVVSPWVQVPYNAASYGADYCGDIVCQDTWRFVNDSIDAFASTFSDPAALNAFLAPYDVWDRYDVDHDGNFHEPDGYIDHFQSVHAGEGEETGGGAQGKDAIWSHRWYAYFGANGPDGAGPAGAAQGGVRIGISNYWIGDYTIEPENGGLGVFAHEFGHDLGLPDLYDTSGNVGGAENSTGFWTLYSSGSYGSSGRPADGIGSKPVPLGNFERFQLGWLNYGVVLPDEHRSIKLGPSWFNSKSAQGVFIVLPDRQVPLDLGAPCTGCGTQFFWSDSGNDLNNTMTRSVASGGALTAKVRYQTEFDWDYAFLESSTDGGSTWSAVRTNRSQTDSDGQSGFNTSRTGITGTTGGSWLDLTATLPAGTNAVRFRYHTDAAFALSGFQVDQIAIGGTIIGTAETGEAGWSFTGFRTTSGSETQSFFNAYILENRQYLGYDKSLKTGPYNFGWDDTTPKLVEHFPYQDGLLISYWNSQYTDNNVGDHPGGGLVLPIDAHPQLSHWRDGTLMRPRILSFDSTFGLDRTPKMRLHLKGTAATIPSRAAVSTFDDDRSYFQDCDPHGCTGAHPGRYQPGWYSVDHPHTGTVVRVRSIDRFGFMRIDVRT